MRFCGFNSDDSVIRLKKIAIAALALVITSKPIKLVGKVTKARDGE